MLLIPLEVICCGSISKDVHNCSVKQVTTLYAQQPSSAWCAENEKIIFAN